MKKITALFLTAALSMASAQNVTSTQIADTNLANTDITIETGKYQGPLSSLLGAVAKSAGYELILEVDVDKLGGEDGTTPVAYSFENKPFNEVWPLLMDVYDLNYTVTNLGDQPVIRVNKEAVQEVVALDTIDAEYALQRAKVFFGSPVKQEAGAGNNADSDETKNAAQQYNFDSPTLRVVADMVADRLIIRGSNQEVTEVANFIRGLDKAATLQRKEQLAQYGAQASEVREEIYRSNGNAEQIANFIALQYPALNVRQLPGNAGLLLRGNGTLIDDALQLLTEIDPAPDGTTQEIFTLANANAKEVAETLSDTLARQLSTAAAKNGSDSSDNNANNLSTATLELAAKEPTIIADQRTNTLIVRGTPAQVEQIAAIIPILDARVPQINLQVRIQEINESATQALGVNWRAAAGGFEVALAGNDGLSATFNPLKSVVGFNIFPTLTALEQQNLAKRVYDATISMQSGQRNLEAGIGSQDASSEAAATIRSGGRLEINIPGPGDSSIEKTIPYGVVLDFFDPIVAPDGTITVRVKGQINSLKNSGAIAEAIADGLPPYLLDFLNSEAQTKISFKPGETVLLTGLNSTTSSASKSGLPFANRVPFLGALTGTQSQKTDSTDMLFVITGDLVK